AAVHRAGLVRDEARARVHLEEGKARLLAQDQPGGEQLGVLGLRGVAVNAHAVPVLGAEEPVRRNAIDLARDVVQSHVQGAVPAAEPALIGEVADTVQDRRDTERVLPHDVRFEDQRHPLVARVAHFAQAVHALVGIDADDGVVEVGRDADRPHVRDSQLARRRIAVDAGGLGWLRVRRTVREFESRSQSRGGGYPFQRLAAADTPFRGGHDNAPFLPNFAYRTPMTRSGVYSFRSSRSPDY